MGAEDIPEHLRNDETHRSEAQKFTGTVSMELTDLIQMLCLSGSDLIIRVKSSSGSGIIYVREGQIHHAQTDVLQGEQAFFEIIAWRDGHFELMPFLDVGVNSVKKAWEHLLLEAMRLRDEGKAPHIRPDHPDGVEDFAEDPEPGELDDRLDTMFDELEQIARQVVDEPSSGTFPSPARPVRILVVDDSSFFSRQLRRMFEEDEDIRVEAVAQNGKECLDILATRPEIDLVTLDIQMPVMKGDTALKHIMIQYPVPVLILSSVQADSLDKIFEFLQLGAVDFMSKPGATEDMCLYGRRLRDTARSISSADVTRFRRPRIRPALNEAGTGTAVTGSNRLLVILGAEGAHMDWFRLPLRRLCCAGLVIGLQKIDEAFLPGFCRLIQNSTGVGAIPLLGSKNLDTGRFYLGNAARKIEVEPHKAGEDLKTIHPVSKRVDWREGTRYWLELLSDRLGSKLGVFFLSAAHSLDPDLVERLQRSRARLILSRRNGVVCTELVDSIQRHARSDADRLVWATPEGLMEVWKQ
jgi:CheY-like chemotaxis protein